MNRLYCLPYLIDDRTRTLILGTFPGEDSLNKQEYYGNEDNIFWDIIYRIFDENWNNLDLVHEIKDYKTRTNFLLDNHIGLWDIISSCTREGSSDIKIENTEYNELETVIKNFPKIEKVLFSSGIAYEFFIKKSNKIIPQHIQSKALHSTSSRCPKNAFLIFKQWKEALKE